ncbi:hypothetical protein MKW92_005838 [Papaver armeniacum]|nr:hypothetical protein MKW92_005838 [Papaver armeniacum]
MEWNQGSLMVMVSIRLLIQTQQKGVLISGEFHRQDGDWKHWGLQILNMQCCVTWEQLMTALQLSLLLVTVMLVCLLLAGAWLGFWVVLKLVLTEEGSIDSSVAVCVAWSIRFVSAVMISQAHLFRTAKSNHKRSQIQDYSPYEDSHDDYQTETPIFPAIRLRNVFVNLP